MGEAELLEVGTSRPRLSRRVRVLLVVLVVLLTAVTVIWERRLHSRDQQAVAVCAADVKTVVELAGRRVATTYEYVRPALADDPRPALERGLLGLVSDAADGAADRLTPTAETCGVGVLALHTDLRAQRDRCLEVLEAQREALAAVAEDGEDGEDVRTWLETPRSC